MRSLVAQTKAISVKWQQGENTKGVKGINKRDEVEVQRKLFIFEKVPFVCVHADVHMKVGGQRAVVLSFTTMWVSETELSSLHLAANNFTCWALSLGHALFLRFGSHYIMLVCTLERASRGGETKDWVEPMLLLLCGTLLWGGMETAQHGTKKNLLNKVFLKLK